MSENTQNQQTTFAIESFLLDCEARGLRTSTMDGHKETILWFLRYMANQGIFCFEDVTKQHARAWLADMRRRELAEATIAGRFATMRVFFNFLVDDDLIEKSPLYKMKVPKADTKLKSAFTDKEIQALLKAAPNDRDKALIWFLLDTGARISEVLAVNIGDVDVKTGRVHLRQTKDREERVVYLGTHAKRQLLRYMRLIPTNPDAALWIILRTKKRLTRRGVTQLLRRLGEVTQIKDYGPHKFRRTFAINFLRNGGDIFTLQRILGHSTLEMVRKYLGALNDDDAHAAHKKYSPGDRLKFK